MAQFTVRTPDQLPALLQGFRKEAGLTQGEVAQRLDITVSAGEQTYTLQGLKDLISAGVRMVQPDIVKMGGITGMMQCAAVCFAPSLQLGERPPLLPQRPLRAVLVEKMNTTVDGEYQRYSVESGEPIPRERLEARPWATLLVSEKVGGLGRR